MAEHECDPTLPAQAQFKVLRAASYMVKQTAEDMADEERRQDLVGLFDDHEISDMDRLLLLRALHNLAEELRVRADQTWDANVAYLSLVLKQQELRN